MKHAMCLLSLLLCATAYGQQEYSVRDVADAMLAAESQFNEISYTYQNIGPLSGEKNAVGIRKETGVYRIRGGGGQVYRQSRWEDTLSDGSTPSVTRDEVVSFDGKRTVWLNNIPGTSGIRRAAIFAGKTETEFQYMLPSEYIWKMARNSWATRLTEAGAKFSVQKEKVDDLDTLKVDGTVAGGQLTVTLWVCPSRSFLPIRTRVARVQDGREIGYRRLGKLTQIDNGMWYPQEILCGPPTDVDATITLKDITTAKQPDESFIVKMPPNTHVTDTILKLSFNTLDPMNAGVDQIGRDNKAMEPATSTQKALDEFVAGAQQDRQSLPTLADKTVSRKMSDSWMSMNSTYIAVGAAALMIIVAALVIGKWVRNRRGCQ